MSSAPKDAPSPIRPTDDAARRLAQGLVADARFAALAVLAPGDTHPMVTRIALATDPLGAPLTLISELSLHTKALRTDPRASLLVGEPGPKGDPLTHPRLTLQVLADLLPASDKATLRALYLAQHPKAQLYIDFSDFLFVRFSVIEAYLNAGFGKAFHLGPDDLRP